MAFGKETASWAFAGDQASRERHFLAGPRLALGLHVTGGTAGGDGPPDLPRQGRWAAGMAVTA